MLIVRDLSLIAGVLAAVQIVAWLLFNQRVPEQDKRRYFFTGFLLQLIVLAAAAYTYYSSRSPIGFLFLAAFADLGMLRNAVRGG